MRGDAIRIHVRVKPGASRNRVGGRYGGDALVVAVQAPAVDGRATRAALRDVARALGCSPSDVRLVSGVTSRSKVLDIPDACAQEFARLLQG